MIALTQAELKAVFTYNKRTGVLRWRIQPAQGVPRGSVAGSLHPQGYVMVQVNGKIYAAHRLIWVLLHGVEPDVINHVNGTRWDNRASNLENVTRTENLQLHRKARSDSTTGLLGVTYRADCNKYQSKIRRNGVTVHLGTFNSPEEAHAKYCAAKEINMKK